MKPIFRPTMEELFEDICHTFHQDPTFVRYTDLKKEDMVKCRRVFAYVGYVILRYQGVDLARYLGYPDHTSICYHVKNIRGWFKIKESKFMDQWNDYTENSKIWPLIKDQKQAA